MSDMNGNPHYDYAENAYEAGDDHAAQASATLALAYEQRTANLIAYYSMGAQITGQKPEHARIVALAERMGITDE